MKTYILIVAGYDYANGGVNFSYIADKRRLYLLQQNPSWANDPDVVFVRFDVKAGKIERNTSNGTTRSWSPDSGSFTAISRSAHYQSEHFISADTNVLSITDAYRYVSSLGATEPGTVREFSVMGHGWYGGPVLVNSFERSEFAVGGSRYPERDPRDKDGRTKDFTRENMSDTDWNNFQNAFASDGYCWVWGCVFTRAYYNTLYKIMQTPSFKSKAFGTHQDTDSFTITVNDSFVTSYYDADRNFFPRDNNERTFTRTLLELKNFLKRGMRRAYPGKLAGDTGIECRAAFLGTYSDYERAYPGHNITHAIMIVPRHVGVYGTDFTKTINFFKTYLNMPEDPESRGYGVYTNAMVNQWWNEAIA